MQELNAYVQGRLDGGIPKAEIREELLAVGWSEEQTELAYRQALIARGIPLPDASAQAAPARRAAAVDVALHLFTFVLLSLVVYGLGSLYFGILDLALPDALQPRDAGAREAVRHAVASLAVALPVYLIGMRLWLARVGTAGQRVESGLSKWLTYIVLLVAAVSMLGDLIAVLYSALQGELSARFVSKSAVLLVLAAGVFGFYVLERRRVQYARAVPARVFQAFAWGAVVATVAGIALGLQQTGSPHQARLRAFDQQRVERLGTLASCIESYARQTGQLPTSLAALRAEPRYGYCSASMRDPETASEFEYRPLAPAPQQGQAAVGNFILCATFDLPGTSREAGSSAVDDGLRWRNRGSAGHVCRSLSVQLGKP